MTFEEFTKLIRWADAAREALPINEDADALVTRLLNESRPSGYVTRKLPKHTKCPGCRCYASTKNVKCGCCGLWPDSLQCRICGDMGRFDTDLLMMADGPTHDRCVPR